MSGCLVVRTDSLVRPIPPAEAFGKWSRPWRNQRRELLRDRLYYSRLFIVLLLWVWKPTCALLVGLRQTWRKLMGPFGWALTARAGCRPSAVL